MIESPMVKELVVDTMRTSLIEVLAGRFGPDARALQPALRAIEDDKRLKRLLNQCGKCPDLESFKQLIRSERRERK